MSGARRSNSSKNFTADLCNGGVRYDLCSRGSSMADQAPVLDAHTHGSGSLLRQFVRINVTMGARVAVVFFAVVHHRCYLVDHHRV